MSIYKFGLMSLSNFSCNFVSNSIALFMTAMSSSDNLNPSIISSFFINSDKRMKCVAFLPCSILSATIICCNKIRGISVALSYFFGNTRNAQDNGDWRPPSPSTYHGSKINLYSSIVITPLRKRR